ncbi:MAG: hypothetical protein II814_11845 [Treponema sp.]|nr:hypothetical protein [Treponema sp.]
MVTTAMIFSFTGKDFCGPFAAAFPANSVTRKVRPWGFPIGKISGNVLADGLGAFRQEIPPSI